MSIMTAFCGIDCSKCPAFVAHQTNDDELRKKTALEWAKMFDYNFKPEEINCVGCTVSEGVHVGYCGMCEIRKCGVGKKVETCAHCDEYICVELEGWFKKVPDAKKTLDEINKKRKR